MDNALISSQNISYSVGGRTLVDGLTCSIQQGRRTFLIGPNGAGKSLAMKLWHGLLTPTSGQLSWDGQDWQDDFRTQQSMVFQSPVMLRRSVQANLEFVLSSRGVENSKTLIADALKGAELDHLTRRPARVLSGGEAQRLAIVRALIVRPRLLLLDEPTSNLDPGATMKIENLIKKASAQGVTIVMVSHSVGQVKRLAQDIVFMDGGRVIETGPANEVLSAPKNEETAMWLDGGLVRT